MQSSEATTRPKLTSIRPSRSHEKNDQTVAPQLNPVPGITGTDQAQARQLRAAIKQIAREVDQGINAFESSTNKSFRHSSQLEDLEDSMIQAQTRLRSYRASGLATSPPPASLMRTARCAAALTAGALSRTGAATVSGAAVGAYAALVGVTKGVCVPVGILAAVTVVPAVFAHAAVQAMRNTGHGASSLQRARDVAEVVGAFTATPVTSTYEMVAARGSDNKKVFRMLDGFPTAKAYAWRQKASTSAIAESIDLNLTATLARIEAKRQRFPKIVYDPTANYLYSSGYDGGGGGGGDGG